MRPQDIVILLKVLCYGHNKWYHKDLAKSLYLSNAEVSNALERCAASGLIDTEKRKVRTMALLDFLKSGIQYVFPQRPGGISRGLFTGHSHPFMKEHFDSDQPLVWPDAQSNEKGLSVAPLYPGAVNAAKADERLYLMLSLIDVVRMGKAREKTLAISELEKAMLQ